LRGDAGIAALSIFKDAMNAKNIDERIKEYTNQVSLTGHPRSYYKELKNKKELELGFSLLGSIGFVKRELFSSCIWVNSFNESDTYDSKEEIFIKYRNDYERIGIEIVRVENDGEELMIWLSDKKWIKTSPKRDQNFSVD
jgi:hypothetical protein